MFEKIVKNARYTIPIVLIISATLSLSAALTAEHVFGIKPCVLCTYQRMPFAFVLIISLISLIISKHYNLAKVILVISMIAFLVGSSIAIFHVGVEDGYWKGTEGCVGSTEDATSIEDLMAKITAAPVVRCDEPQFRFLGFTIAAYNAMYSFLLAAFCVRFLRMIRYRENSSHSAD